MDNIFTMDNILTVVSMLLTVTAIVIGYYQYIKRIITEKALDGINSAEDTDKVRQEKMAEAVKTVYELIPAVARPFISEKLVETIIQGIFDKAEEYAKKQVDKENNKETVES